MTIRSVALALILASLALAACSKKNDAQERREADAAVAEQLPPGPATLQTTDSVAGDAPGTNESDSAANASLPSNSGAAQMTVPVEFDASSVPVTSANLPPFPFFKDPEGLENELKGPDAMKSFDRHGFIAGGKVVTQEGR